MLSVLTLRFAHPATSISNAAELNPILTGHSSSSHFSARYLISPRVGLGEISLDNEVHYHFSQNQRPLMICKYKKKAVPFATDLKMFHAVPPRETDSDQQIVLS